MQHTVVLTKNNLDEIISYKTSLGYFKIRIVHSLINYLYVSCAHLRSFCVTRKDKDYRPIERKLRVDKQWRLNLFELDFGMRVFQDFNFFRIE